MSRFAVNCLILCAALWVAPLRADLEVNVRKDTITLTDGTVIPCLILVITEKAVLVVETDPEDSEVRRQRAIPRHVIKSIERGESDGATEGLQTESSLARKVIAGTGFRDEETPKSKEPKEKKTDKKDPNDKTTAVPDKKPKTKPVPTGPIGPDKGGITYGGNVTKIPTQGAAGGIKGSPKDMADAYLQRFPALREAAQSYLGADRLPQTFDLIQKGDGPVRAQAESFLGVFMGSDSSAIGQTINLGGAGIQVRPGRGERGPKRVPKDRPAAGQ